MEKNKLKILRLSLDSLTIFDDILKENKVSAFMDLLDGLSSPRFDYETVHRLYFRFYKEMIGFNWKGYILDLIIRSENKLALAASTELPNDHKRCILENARRDLHILEKLSEVESQEILDLISSCISREMPADQDIFTTDLNPREWPPWDNSMLFIEMNLDLDNINAVNWLQKNKSILKEQFDNNRWADNVQSLLEHYSEVGYGVYSDYAAFRVSDSGYELEGIEEPDPIRINNLICQEREQSIVLQNTEFFLEGYRANNIILYGNRGTGKSSLVKALINEYVSRGLRLVQLKKSQMELFPKLLGQLSKIPLKFIIFIDDLSFDAAEETYKSLKSLLEGGIEVRPNNVLIYATSNRKHLVTENFAERRSNDVHAQDNMEEKLSLADRFGITVTFLSPDQEIYLRIAEGLAMQSGIEMDKEELREKAKRWTMMHNSRSGRTARQFIDYLKGELGIK